MYLERPEGLMHSRARTFLSRHFGHTYAYADREDKWTTARDEVRDDSRASERASEREREREREGEGGG